MRLEHLSAAVREGRKVTGEPQGDPPAAGSGDIRTAVADLEKRTIEATLKEMGGNKSQAARALGISRFALHRKLDRDADIVVLHDPQPVGLVTMRDGFKKDVEHLLGDVDVLPVEGVVEARLRLHKKSNDFSSWLEQSHGEAKLANEIEELNPYRYGLDGLREKIAELVEARVSK